MRGILRNHTGLRFHPLTGPNGENPAFAFGGQLQFNLNTIPKLTGGNLANYLLGIVVTVFGNIDWTNAGAATGGTRVRDLIRALFADFEMHSAWHGRPLHPQTIRGRTLDVLEYLACGYQTWGRHRPPFGTADGAKPFKLSFFLPLCHGFGDKPHHTAQLSILYKDAQLLINANSLATFQAINAGVPQLGSISGGPGVGSATIRCSAVLLPEPELRLGPASEWMEFRTPGAVAGSDAVDVIGLGQQTALQGVEPGAAIDMMIALGAADFAQTGPAPDGSFSPETLSRFSAPFLDQTQTLHLEPFADAFSGMIPTHEDALATANSDSALAGEAAPFTRFPYSRDGGPYDSTQPIGPGLVGFPLRFATPDLELTKVPVFEGNVTYYRTISATVNSVDRTLVHQFKSWSPNKMADFRELLIQEGLALKVEGSNDISNVPKLTRKNVGSVDAHKLRFLPQRWVGPRNKVA